MEKQRKDYTIRLQFNEKPCIIPGCLGSSMLSDDDAMVSSKQGTARPHSIHKEHLACDICC